MRCPVALLIIGIGRRAATAAHLDEGLQGREAGAGDADGYFDGGPEEGAHVRGRDVRLVDVEDGPDAGDGGGADAGGFVRWGLIIIIYIYIYIFSGQGVGRGDKIDVQSAQEENSRQRGLLSNRKAEAPDGRHGEHKDDDVECDIRDGGAEEGGVAVDAFAVVGVGADPGGLDGDALEEGGEDDGQGPGGHEGEEEAAGVFEGFGDAEEAVVEEEDGEFDEGDGDAVEDFVPFRNQHCRSEELELQERF